jgi:hypothetical protein
MINQIEKYDCHIGGEGVTLKKTFHCKYWGNHMQWSPNGALNEHGGNQ